jgi:predicted  nucleic acid-binding Zn-ribbon protein
MINLNHSPHELLAFLENNLYNLIMSQISNLYRLQQIDSQLDTINTKLISIENVLLDNSSVQSAQQIFSNSEELLSSSLKKLREAENKSYDTRIKTEFAESSLYGGKIQNPKELQEIQNEVVSLKRLLTNLDDTQLDTMMEVEEAEAFLRKAKEELIESQKFQIERNAVLDGEKTKLLSEIDRLESERKATIPTILASDLGMYDQLRKSRNGVAVAKINSRACTACGSTLTAAIVQASQSTGQIIRCPNCGRFLYPG